MESTDETSLGREDLIEIARARASFLTFVNVHFTSLPDLGFVDQVRGSEFTAALEALAGDEVAHADTSAGASLMLGYLRSHQSTDAARLSESLGVDRTKLYRGVSPGYGPPPLYEAVWTSRTNDTASVLKEIAAIYREAGMAISPDAMERLDYVGVELEYQRLLADREAEAWEAGEEEQARELLARQAGFMRDHLAQWVPAFIEKALEQAETDFYRGHLMMLRGFLADEQERLEALLAEV